MESAAQAIRIARFTINGRIGVGRVEGDKVALLGIATVAEATAAPSAAAAGAAIPISQVEFLSPIDEAAKIICVGFNYAGHMCARSAVQLRNTRPCSSEPTIP
jgi:2-keto-4-pentenoate hydratase/2-oxohepta-3-ene-1,7-dioic acid hydratase in catechol pathway